MTSRGAQGLDAAIRRSGAMKRERAWVRALQTALLRLGLALMLLSPGAAAMWAYGRRVVRLRADPALSPGPPLETWLAIVAAGLAMLSMRAVLAALRGGLGARGTLAATVAMFAVAAALAPVVI